MVPIGTITPTHTPTSRATETPTTAPTGSPTAGSEPCDYYVVEFDVKRGKDGGNSYLDTGASIYIPEGLERAVGDAPATNTFEQFKEYMEGVLPESERYYFDINGNPLPDKGEKECGKDSITAYWSPIALDLGPEKPWALVRFPLNPSAPSAYVTWKASDTRPLLV